MAPKKKTEEAGEAPVKVDRLAAAMGIAASLNRSAKAKNKAAAPVAFVAHGNEARLQMGRLSSGNLAIDEVIGGGWAKGALNMIVGAPGCGKTCACFSTIAAAQKTDPRFVPVYINLESATFPWEQALNAGVDMERLLVVPAANTGEAALETMFRFLWDGETKMPRNLVDLIVLDSIAAVVPSAEIDSVDEKGLASATVGRQAALFSKAFRVLLGGNRLGTATLLAVNQQRQDIGSYAGGITLPGGKAVLYYSKISLELSAPRSKFVKEERKIDGEKQEVVLGHTVVLKCLKNNTGSGHPHARGEYVVRFGEGVDTIPPLLNAAVRRGIIAAGAVGWFRWQRNGEEQKLQGRDAMERHLRDDAGFRAWLEEQIAADVALSTTAHTPAADGALLEELEEVGNSETPPFQMEHSSGEVEVVEDE